MITSLLYMVIAGKHEFSSSMDESVQILSHGTQDCVVGLVVSAPPSWHSKHMHREL